MAQEQVFPDKSAGSSVPLLPVIAHRWSPRALDPTAEVTDEQVRALLEAARWAPSFGNTQPARYLLGRRMVTSTPQAGLRPDDTFTRIHGVLNPGNQEWAHAAALLLLGVALTRNDKGDLPYAEYGVGLASANLVLQAVAEGLVAHQMAGFHAEAARAEFDLPADARPLVVIAVGKLGDPATLSERNRRRELAERHRIPLAEFAYSDTWGRPAF